MRDQPTSNREAELPAPPRIGSGDWLDPKIVNADCLIEMPSTDCAGIVRFRHLTKTTNRYTFI
jgi:hypothetical protein